MILFGRSYSLNLNGILVSQLHIEFDVTHTKASEPNTASITIYNLSAATRQSLSSTVDPLIQLDVGYEGENALLFLGAVRKNGIVTKRDGADWSTKIDIGDGEAKIRKGHASVSFPAGTSVSDVIDQLIGITGIKPGNIAKTIKDRGVAAAFTEFSRGFSFSGNAHSMIRKIGKTVGLNVSVQDEKYTAFELAGGTTPGQSYKISPTSGMVGSPDVGDKNIVKVQSLLLPEVRPGHSVEVASANVNGFFRVEAASHQGSYRSNDWYTTMDLRAI